VTPDLVLEGLGELPELLAAWHDGTLDDARTDGQDG
jgi:hypothetical protein